MKNINATGKEARKERCERLKATVLILLQCSEMQYAAHVYKNGLLYLKHYMEDVHAADQISRSRIFWNWWMNHWNKRNESFVEVANANAWSKALCVEMYDDLHNGKKLARCIYPNSTVLNESYAVMITDLVHATQHA